MQPSNEVIVSVSGIRGIIGEGLTPELATRFAAALGSYLGGQRVVVCRDGRPSGAMLRHAVLAGFFSSGCEVKDIGIAPTPTCGLAVRRLEAAGGMQITASHNPAEWNGLKLFGPDGAVLTAAEGRKIKELFESGPFHRVGWNELGQVDGLPASRGLAPRARPGTGRCRRKSAARQLRTFLDANGGAGGPLGRQLLEALQAQPVGQGCDADGHLPARAGADGREPDRGLPAGARDTAPTWVSSSIPTPTAWP